MNVRSYNKIVDLYADNLFRFALKMLNDKDLAQDVVQSSFEKLWLKKDTINEQKAKSYLFTTAHHLIIDYFRKNKPSYTDNDQIFQSQSYQPIAHDVKEILDKALEQLPEIQKTVILLRDYEGYSYKEIAEITALTEEQVKVYIFRGRKKLKSILVSMDLLI
jgi:RNA polymerase sigma-70 factor (ECF subfamily)